MAYIPRAIEPLLSKKYRTYKSVAVTGARQVGKTTLTKKMFPSMRRVNLMNLALLQAANADPDGFMKSFPFPYSSTKCRNVPPCFLLPRPFWMNKRAMAIIYSPVRRNGL